MKTERLVTEIEKKIQNLKESQDFWKNDKVYTRELEIEIQTYANVLTMISIQD